MATDGTDGDDRTTRFETYRRTGDTQLRNQLIEEHLNLARGFARRYRNRGVPIEDLEQTARLGLIGAVERFDPEVGVRFETFASRTIDGELKRYFRDRAWSVRVPRHYQDLGIAIRTAMEQLTKQLGRTPSIPELADSVGVEVDEVLAAMEAAQAFRATSIDGTNTGDEGDRPPAESLAAIDPGPGLFENRELIGELLTRLPARERRIVELRFFGERSQRDIAEEIGISQMHVSRLLRSALTTLRDAADPDRGDHP